ncbi:hypothetical protein C8Q79DRAFT_642701 [Trametes meyenii]|nr:hypothetical protein C8Q79DRAFT_642701 [Trametes meyenii]
MIVMTACLLMFVLESALGTLTLIVYFLMFPRLLFFFLPRYAALLANDPSRSPCLFYSMCLGSCMCLTGTLARRAIALSRIYISVEWIIPLLHPCCFPRAWSRWQETSNCGAAAREAIERAASNVDRELLRVEFVCQVRHILYGLPQRVRDDRGGSPSKGWQPAGAMSRVL